MPTSRAVALQLNSAKPNSSYRSFSLPKRNMTLVVSSAAGVLLYKTNPEMGATLLQSLPIAAELLR